MDKNVKLEIVQFFYLKIHAVFYKTDPYLTHLRLFVCCFFS